MKKGPARLLAALAIFALLLLFPEPDSTPSSPPPAPGRGSANRPGEDSSPAAAAKTQRQVSQHQQAPSSAETALENLTREGRLLDSREIALPGPGGRHTRSKLYETSFKYPAIRIDETWERLPDGSGRRLSLVAMVADHAMMRFPKEIDRSAVEGWCAKQGLTIRRKFVTDDIYLVQAPRVLLDAVENLISSFKKDFDGRELAIAEPDYLQFAQVTPNDPQLGSLWGLHNTGQDSGKMDADIDAPEAWAIHTGSRNVVVGVIDTGVDRTHPDLAPNLWTNPREIPGNGLDDDNNGFKDDLYGWDFYGEDADPSDANGHGTHCSGTIGAAGNNSLGVVGVNWQVSIVGLRFLGPSGSGASSDAAEAVNYSRILGLTLTSNSWGGGGYSAFLEQAIAASGAAGQLFIASAGNSSQNNDSYANYPSNYSSDNIVVVAATTRNDQLASYSNYGPQLVDLAAPGSEILSTIPGAAYGTKSGTSMAAPHVAGAAALIYATQPGIKAGEVKQLLMDTADPVPLLAGTSATGGRLNLHKALESISRPHLIASPVAITEVSGNGDAIANPGETFVFDLSFRNGGREPANGVAISAVPQPAVPGVSILESPYTPGDLASNQSSPPCRFTVVLGAGLATPLDLKIVFTASDAAGGSWSRSEKLPVYTRTRINGQVSRADGGGPLPGATLSYRGPSSGSVTTDAAGHYEIAAIDGTYQIQASAAGFASSLERSLTVPPDASSIDFSLGLPALRVNPASIALTLPAGTSATRTVQLVNQGDGSLTWEATAGPVASSLATDLVGVRVALSSASSNRTLIRDSMQSRGASVSTFQLPVTSAKLANVDVFLLEDAVGTMSNAEIAELRTWIEAGGSLLLEADGLGSLSESNALLAGTGIQERYLGLSLENVLTDFTAHPITAGVASLQTLSMGCECIVSGGSALSIARDTASRTLAAVSKLNRGLVLVLGDELSTNAKVELGDGNKRFVDQSIGWLAARARWLRVNGTVSGFILSGEDATVEIVVDAALMDAGVYQSSLVIVSNELGNGRTEIPVTLTVTGAPAISLSPASLVFSGTSYVGKPRTQTLTISNPGSDQLLIQGIESTHPAFAVQATLPAFVQPHKTLELPVSFNPLTPGPYTGTLKVTSNAPTQPLATRELGGVAAVGPIPAIAPAPLSASLPFGTLATKDLTLSNSGDRTLNWSLDFTGQSSFSDPLAETLSVLDKEYASIGNLIPDRYDFGDGRSGKEIIDGGGNMFDTGNRLATSLATAATGFNYSDGVITSGSGSPWPFGASGRYFTRKYPGFFVLAADNAGATWFQTNGGLGADGAGSVESSSIVMNHHGKNYRGFIKRVFGTSEPSVNHLFIVEENPALIQTHSPSTDSDEHRLSGLAAGQRFYYLLYASANGSRIPDEIHRSIMEAFLKCTVDASSWLGVSPVAGALPAGQSTTVQASFNAFDHAPGNYQGTLTLQHDGAGEAPRVPVSLQIGPGPLLDVSPSTLQFPATSLGSHVRLTFTVTNRGYGTLEATPILTGGAPAFGLTDAASFRLERGESRILTVEFTPTATGGLNGTLGFSGPSAAGAPFLTLLGEGLPAGPLGVALNPLDLTIPAGSSTTRTLTLSNAGAESAAFTATIEDAAPFHTGRNLAGLRVLVVTTESSSYKVLTSRLEKANAHISFQNASYLGPADLEGADVIVATNNFSAIQLEMQPLVRAWCSAGGGLVFHPGIATTTAKELLAGTGLTPFGDNSAITSGTISEFEPHVITRGLAPFSSGAFSANLTVTPPAKVLARLSSGRIACAATTLGRGRVVVVPPHWPIHDTHPDVVKGVELSARAAEWVSRRRSHWLVLGPTSGSIAAGASQTLTATVDTSELDAGTYAEEIVIRSGNAADAAVRLPVRLVASGEPQLAVQPGALDFAGTYHGHPVHRKLTLVNEGRAPLTVQAADSSISGLVAEGSFPLIIPPLQKTEIALGYDPPGPVANLAGHVALRTDAPGQAEVQIPVTGSVLAPPVLQTPASLSLSVGSNSTVAVPLSIGNAGGSPLSWQLAYHQPLAELPLEDVLATLDRTYLQITATIPNRYDFTGGFTGNSIRDGGAGMYATYGNSLRRGGTGTNLVYSDGVIIPAEYYLCPGGRYFTRKYPGLFIFAADIKDLPGFEIVGQLSYGTGSTIDGASMAVQRGSKVYRGFTKRARGGTLPSINHLFIVEDRPTLSHYHSSNQTDDYHSVAGLEGSHRLYYLLYSSSAGGNVDDTRTRQIIEAFITAVEGDFATWSGAPASGETPVSGNSPAQITVNTGGLAPGIYRQAVMVSSNDPAKPLVEIPLILQVLPPLTFSPAALNFGNVIRGDVATRTVTLTNTTTAALNLSGGSVASGPFNGRFPANATLPAVGSLVLPVTFAPVTDGAASASLGLNSSVGSFPLQVTGNAVAPGDFPMNDFIAWRNGHFPVGEPFTGLHDDPDGDGLDLAMEYAFLGNPKQSERANPLRVISRSPSVLRIGYTRRADFPDTRIRFQRSPGLEDWTSFLQGAPVITPGAGGAAEVELEIPHGGLPTFFLRAAVE